MKINIYGSTGVIGSKILHLINHYNLSIKVNLLVCKKNYRKLIYQSKKYKAKYIYIEDKTKIPLILNKITKSILIPNKEELDNFLYNSKSNMSILAIDGLDALNYINQIIYNTENLGIVNKECIVSAGHLFKKFNYFKKTNLYPIDSEHFSLFKFFNQFKRNKKINKINKIYLTASGGSLYKQKNINSKISYKKIINHPKWKMGYKNSIDSSSLANKCLEIIEAKYLFDLDFKDISIIIHPEALVHSIVEFKDYTYVFNYFYNDMNIPLMNFLSSCNNVKLPVIKRYQIESNFSLSFDKKSVFKYPIYNIFNSMNKNKPENLVKFNLLNEYAVKLYANRKLDFHQIPRFIKKNMLLNDKEKNNLNTINQILDYNKNFINKLNAKYPII